MGKDLIFDWNLRDETGIEVDRIKGIPKIELDDETLRDGLQSPSVTHPNVEQKIKFLHYMEKLGIQIADIAFPAAGPAAKEDAIKIAKEISNNNMKIRAGAAGRTVIEDIQPILEVSQAAGIEVDPHLFIGSSPIRQYVEGWKIDKIVSLVRNAVDFSVKNDMKVMLVTEDTTRTYPEDIKVLYTEAIEAGADRICVCDTVGHAVPQGVRRLIQFVKTVVKDTNKEVKVDWHAHNDRYYSLANSLAAIEAGADRIHGTILGIGERAGNTPLDLLMVNLKLLGIIDNDVSELKSYVEYVSESVKIPIPANYCVFGNDAFRTATGVHAAAIIKAMDMQEGALADLIYSGVPANMFGAEQVIEIGPMSGKSNIQYWLRTRNIESVPELVDKIFDSVKQENRALKEEEIFNIVNQFK